MRIMPVFSRFDTSILIHSTVLKIHQETHTRRASGTSEETWLPSVLFLSPPFVFQMHQQMAVQSSKFVPCMTFSLEKGRSLLRVNFQTFGSRCFVSCHKQTQVFGCSFSGLYSVGFLATVKNLKMR